MKSLSLQGRLGDILSLIAGGLLPLAFAPLSLFPLAVLLPALLFLLWQNISPKRAFWRGLLFGIGLFGIGVSWVYVSFHQFGGIPMIGAIFMTAGFVLALALYPALLGWLLTRFFPNNTLSKIVLVLPAAWTLTEWLRGWLFTGFPWLNLGYSQIDSPLNGFAPLLGVYGVSWMTVFTASLLVYLFNFKKLIILPMVIIIWGSGWFLSGVSWTQPVNKPLDIALIQGNVPQEYKWLSSFQIPSMQRYLQLSQAHRDADIIIWPETAVPLFYSDVLTYAPGFLEQLTAEHTTYNTDFLIGIPILLEDGKTYFNSVTSIGTQSGAYYKHHLVPFGEYIPFQSFFGNLLKLLDVPMSAFSPGAVQQPNLHSMGEPIGVSICYEDVFGELVRNSLPTATLLVNVSNDAWFGDSIAPHQHLEIARMRALESGRYLLRATNTGISAVIDVKGKITAQAPQFKITTLRAKAQPYQGVTPYIHFGNSLVMILLLLCMLGGVIKSTCFFSFLGAKAI
ncbi:apolipoprotein N-acyltransferase [Candidatus Parabeggiatoa sp. HSG14]|uniref:apolipoprotein N-acyltransferase n=1 Tax=Candidatus Parabeggiatoa sp. HSG14 TaxID=3055593 RepID=UPI0025A91E46|nr:apolipoprotein N-acyltransferase [Thiotrichales bacterium HSG14]